MRRFIAFAGLAAAALFSVSGASALTPVDWGQWGQNSEHEGFVPVVAQSPDSVLADVVYDPFSNKENTGEGTSVHYQTPLVSGNDVFMEFKTGNFSTLKNWETQMWGEKRLSWVGGKLTEQWAFWSDWKPVPYASNQTLNGPTWEPVFHAVLTDAAIYIPGAGGSIYKVDRATGTLLAQIKPFGPTIDRTIFVAGPLSADTAGNVYYNAIQLDKDKPWDTDVRGAWLVKVAPDNSVRTATWASLTPGTPAGTDLCTFRFSTAQLPWPPSPDAIPPKVQCGSQRPGINVAPAIGPDGTIYDVSRAQLIDRWAYLIAIKPDLTPKWVASMRERFTDGCGVETPMKDCRAGTTVGVEPSENQAGSGRVLDESTSSPTVAPDGSVYYGAYTRWNYAQGHLMRFSKQGRYLGAYHFGWDITPGIYRHDGTYSVVIKDNHYGDVGSYCNDPAICPPDRSVENPAYPEAYFVTQLNPSLGIEWTWQNKNTDSCTRTAAGVTCTPTNPNGFEWCINAPAIDANGTVYGNSEDGWLYAINQGGTLKKRTFLEIAIEAAYTPLSIGSDGKIYAENFGHLVAVGQ
jgi:hypothetical protein